MKKWPQMSGHYFIGDAVGGGSLLIDRGELGDLYAAGIEIEHASPEIY
jgi:hypothetical protein